MNQKSLYDALLVEQDATLDEIKVAFKKRALQVHPDKGGSKEAFHLVYQALEILADPEARRKYDHGLAIQKSGKTSPGRKSKTSKKCDHFKAPKEVRSKPKSRSSKTRTRNVGSQAAAPKSREDKLLTKIRDLLKQLPRDVRNDVIATQFSQRQRLILEKWMADASRACGTKAGPLQAQHKEMIQDTLDVADDSCNALVVPSEGRPSVTDERPATMPSAVHKIRDKLKESRKRVRNACGSLHKNTNQKDPSSYAARICFDSVELSTRYSDLQTALEYLMILTLVKQKMQESTGLQSSFEERLQAALVSSGTEHGKDIADLNVRFAVNQRAGFFIGKQFMLKSPCVRSIEGLKQLRVLLDPFRVYARKQLKGAQMFWQYSPAHLQQAWERFQKAVAEAWEFSGVDSKKFMQKVRVCHRATESSRQRNLDSWERQHMAMQDKSKCRPKRLQDKNTKNLERQERQHMARHDKDKHRPRALRDKTTNRLEHYERQQMAKQDKNRHRPRRLRVSFQKCPVSKKLLVVKALLGRWEQLLNKQVYQANKEYRKVVRLRKLQQKKDQEKQRHLEVLNRKRIRQEERLRKEMHRKRMKSRNFMDDIQWIWRYLNWLFGAWRKKAQILCEPGNVSRQLSTTNEASQCISWFCNILHEFVPCAIL